MAARHGVPREKLIVVPNAPGYAISPALLRAALHRRIAPAANEPLRVVCIGRLDGQKGVASLVAAIKKSQTAGLNVNWRIIGSAIMGDDNGASWSDQLSELGIRIEPPIFDSEKLTDAYLQNDIFVLTSRWVGRPCPSSRLNDWDAFLSQPTSAPSAN